MMERNLCIFWNIELVVLLKLVELLVGSRWCSGNHYTTTSGVRRWWGMSPWGKKGGRGCVKQTRENHNVFVGWMVQNCGEWYNRRGFGSWKIQVQNEWWCMVRWRAKLILYILMRRGIYTFMLAIMTHGETPLSLYWCWSENILVMPVGYCCCKAWLRMCFSNNAKCCLCLKCWLAPVQWLR